MELEERAEALAVRVRGTHHEDHQVHEERGPAHHEGPQEDGEGEGPSHGVAPPAPAPPLAPPTPVGGQGGNFPGVDASQHEHVGVDEVDDHHGDDEEGHEAGPDDVQVEEPHHEHRREAARRPDGGQDGACAPLGHDVVVLEGVEDGYVAETNRNDKEEST